MTQQELLKEFVSLPPDAQRQVTDFISFLHQKHQAQTPVRKKNSELQEGKFIGMWRDRADLGDSTNWVRDIREKEWSK